MPGAFDLRPVAAAASGGIAIGSGVLLSSGKAVETIAGSDYLAGGMLTPYLPKYAAAVTAGCGYIGSTTAGSTFSKASTLIGNITHPFGGTTTYQGRKSNIEYGNINGSPVYGFIATMNDPAVGIYTVFMRSSSIAGPWTATALGGAAAYDNQDLSSETSGLWTSSAASGTAKRLKTLHWNGTYWIFILTSGNVAYVRLILGTGALTLTSNTSVQLGAAAAPLTYYTLEPIPGGTVYIAMKHADVTDVQNYYGAVIPVDPTTAITRVTAWGVQTYTMLHFADIGTGWSNKLYRYLSQDSAFKLQSSADGLTWTNTTVTTPGPGNGALCDMSRIGSTLYFNFAESGSTPGYSWSSTDNGNTWTQTNGGGYAILVYRIDANNYTFAKDVTTLGFGYVMQPYLPHGNPGVSYPARYTTDGGVTDVSYRSDAGLTRVTGIWYSALDPDLTGFKYLVSNSLPPISDVFSKSNTYAGVITATHTRIS